MESLPPHPAWAKLLHAKAAGALSEAVVNQASELLEQKGPSVPARPLCMLISIARDLDSGMVFRATESD